MSIGHQSTSIMANALLICSRSQTFGSKDIDRFTDIERHLTPDNLVGGGVHSLSSHTDRTFSLIWPVSRGFSFLQGESMLVGALLEPETVPWAEPGAVYPDGTYAILRMNRDQIELVPDHLGSRTIWYFLDDKLFVASTSQRAIIRVLGSFSFNRETIPWMLANGALGPGQSWDTRIHAVPANRSVLLDRKAWTVDMRDQVHERYDHPGTTPKEKLQSAIRSTIMTLDRPEYDNAVLPLSGGYDSRGILCFMHSALKRNGRPRTLTWGLKSMLRVTGSDAQIAVQLAQTLNVPHQYIHIDMSDEPIDALLERFFRNGEGRVDHVSGYIDGFELWRRLHAEGIPAIIRGDEVFGWNTVQSESGTRASVGLSFVNDFADLNRMSRKYGWSAQKLEGELSRIKDETLESWRDRLYRDYRIPFVLAALTQLKASYCEIANPLMSRRITQVVSTLPDEMRTNKALFRTIVNEASPDTPYATTSAGAPLQQLLRRPDVTAWMLNCLNSSAAHHWMGQALCEEVAYGLRKPRAVIFLARVIRRLRRMAGLRLQPDVDMHRLSFRVCLIVRLCELFQQDAHLTPDRPRDRDAGDQTRPERAIDRAFP